MSDSVWPHRRQPTRVHRPWDSPGKNTGVGCHFLLQCMKVKSEKWSHSVMSDSVTPWTEAYQAPPSMGFSRQEYWSVLPLPSPVEDPRPTQNHTASRIQIPAVWLQSPAVNLCAMNLTGHRHKVPSPSYKHPLQMSRLSICWQIFGCWKHLVRFIRRSKCSTLPFFTSLFFTGLRHIPHRNEDFLLSKHSTLITRAFPEARPWPYGIFFTPKDWATQRNEVDSSWY